MASVEVLLPKMGESVAEATVTRWLKAVGETIEEEESLVEIATDKVDSEVPSPAGGIVSEIFIQEGEVANVGQAIALITTEGTSNSQVQKNSTHSNTTGQTELKNTSQNGLSIDAETKKNEAILEEKHTTVPSDSTKIYSNRFYSPVVRKLAHEAGVSQVDLDSIPGSGKDGRLTKQDFMAWIPNRAKVQSIGMTESGQPKVAQPVASEVDTPKHVEKLAEVAKPIVVNAGEEIIEMDRMRRLIADHMVMSKQTSPHVTCFVESDVTNIVKWRDKVKKEFEEREGEKMTFTPIFIEALIKAIKDFPMVNVSVSGNNIIKKKYINVGMATALPSGNLIVPVIKNADYLNLGGLAKTVNDLSRRARGNKLTPDDISGGTITISNVGTFGNVMGTPIINQPQVAILAVGAIRKKPAVIETPEGDSIGIRHLMYLSLTFDHRVVDGSLGGMFVKRISDYLESFDAGRVV